jgi:hypothetical protein
MNTQATAQAYVSNPSQNNALYPSAAIITQPSLADLASLYKSQERECWLCDKISHKILEAKEISEDDQWHFTSCVLSWEHVHKH